MTIRVIRLKNASRHRLRVAQVADSAVTPADPGVRSRSGSNAFFQTSGGGGDQVVTFDVSSATVNTLLIGSEPTSHGFHFSHDHPDGHVYPRSTFNVFSPPGNWSDTSRWSQGRLPNTDDDEVRIPAGYPLVFPTGTNRTLNFINFLINEDGEVRADWSAAGSEVLTLVGRDVALDTGIDPYQWGNAFWCLGKARFTGKTKTPWVEIEDVLAGATSITTRSTTTGWIAGDQLVFEDTRQFYNEIGPGSADPHEEFEVVTVTSVSGTTVNFTPALSYDHKGPRKKDNSQPLYAAVMNTTRNIVLKSANKDGARSHSGAHGRADVEVFYCEAQDTGRSNNNFFDDTLPVDPSEGPVTHVGTNQRGRYGGFLAHLHHCLGPVRNASEQADANVWQAKLVGCSSWNRVQSSPTLMPRWGLANCHNAHWVLVQNNVGFRHAGAHIIGEQGTERECRIENNFMIHAPHVFQSETSRGAGDVAFASSGIWMKGADSRIVGNRVNGVTRCYIIATITFNPEGHQYPLWKSADPSVSGQYEVLNIRAVPIRQFSGNVGGGACFRFMEIWDLGVDNAGSDGREGMERSTVLDCTSWHVSELAIYNYRDGYVTFDGYKGYQSYVLLGFGLGALCLYSGDYTNEDMRLVDCELHGFGTGWETGSISREQSATGCFFSCYTGIVVTPPWVAGGSPTQIHDHTITLTGCTFENALASDIPAFGPQYGIKKTAFIRETGSNITDLTKLDELIVIDYQGVADDNFDVYYSEQLGSAIFKQTNQWVVGCPVADKTNTQSLADHGVCWGDEIAPADSTTRSGVFGLIKAF